MNRLARVTTAVLSVTVWALGLCVHAETHNVSAAFDSGAELAVINVPGPIGNSATPSSDEINYLRTAGQLAGWSSTELDAINLCAGGISWGYGVLYFAPSINKYRCYPDCQACNCKYPAGGSKCSGGGSGSLTLELH
jgi:hypothetical protein